MVPLYKPYMPKELPELYDLLYSGQLAFGKWGRLFEEKLKSFIGTDYLLVVNTYTSAIQVALATLNLQQGDEVISSPMSCLQSNLPLATYGLNVRWADIDPETGTLDPVRVKQNLSPNTKLIFHNHYCGFVGYVDEINTIAKENGIPVVDDCIEAFGSKYKGKRVGNLGTDVSIFSFQTVRFPNTIDGGAIVFKDKELYEKALLIRDLGIDRSIFKDQYGEISPNCDIAAKGYSATISDFNSYLGCLQMDIIESVLEKQQQNAKIWDIIIHDKYQNIKSISKRDEIFPNYWVYGTHVKDKHETILHFREQGYYASGVHLNNNLYSIFGKQNDLKGVNKFMKSFVALPCGWWVNE